MYKLRPNQLKDYVLYRWALQYKIDRNTVDFKENNHLSNYNTFRTHYKDKLLVYKTLLDLSDSCTPCDMDEVIGNSSWTQHGCTFCGNSSLVTDVISNMDFYKETDYDDTICYVCKYCARGAVEKFESEAKDKKERKEYEKLKKKFG